MQSSFLAVHETIDGLLEIKLVHKYTILLQSCTKSQLEKGHVLVPKVRLLHFTILFKAGLETKEKIMEMTTTTATKGPKKF